MLEFKLVQRKFDLNQWIDLGKLRGFDLLEECSLCGCTTHTVTTDAYYGRYDISVYMRVARMWLPCVRWVCTACKCVCTGALKKKSKRQKRKNKRYN